MIKRQKQHTFSNSSGILTPSVRAYSAIAPKTRNTGGNSQIKLELFRAMIHIAQKVIRRSFPNIENPADASKFGNEAAPMRRNPSFRRRRAGLLAAGR